jgi:DNA-directed RNA polymerase specialized sigma24 family protein
MTEVQLYELCQRLAKRHKIPGMDSGDLASEAHLSLRDSLPLTEEEAKRGINRFIDQLKAKLRWDKNKPVPQGWEQADTLVDPSPSPAALVSSDDTRQYIAQLLSPKQFRIVEATFWDGMNDDEIAEELHTTRRRVQLLRDQALRKVREFF